MNIEEQVVSLEHAKRLKELGIEQDSLWKWCIHSNGVVGCYAGIDRKVQILSDVKEEYSAFTVAELGEILTDMHSGWSSGTSNEYDTDNRYVCDWYNEYGVKHWTSGKTEVEVRARAIIAWLREKDGK